MTDREAIEFFTTELEYSIPGLIMSEEDKLYIKTFNDASELAIQALKEREERSKGCKNCTAGDGEFTVLLEKWGEDNFCPICGRKLKE